MKSWLLLLVTLTIFAALTEASERENIKGAKRSARKRRQYDYMQNNGYSNGNGNGYNNGYQNGYSNNGNGLYNGYQNGNSNGYANGYANGNSNGYVNGNSNGYSNGYSNGASNGIRGGSGGVYGNGAQVNSQIGRMATKRIINIADNWERIPYIFQTYNEPEQNYLMPMLSNGYIGTTVKNDSLYFMGLYNGYNGRSHRVKIPSLTAIEAFLPLYDQNDVITYHFDARRGIYTIQTRNNQVEINQRFYVHRRYKNLIVNEIKVDLLQQTSIIVELWNETRLNLNMAYVNTVMNPNGYSYYFQEHNPENISFEQRVIKHPTLINKRTELNDGIYYLGATIPLTEVANKRQKQIHTYYTNVPSRFTVYNNRTTQYFHFIQSVDSDNTRARSAYDDAIRMISQDPNSLYVQHTSAWEEIWAKAGMASIADQSFSEANQESLKVAQRLYASFYNLYASIPFTYDSQFYGLSPNGLAYGSLRHEYFNNTYLTPTQNRPPSDGYGGHVMYHQELFVLPLVSMFNQDMGRSLIASRVRRGLNTDSSNLYDQARELAKAENLLGLRYPWEQGDYGVDVSPFTDTRKSKIHVSADISFGIRSYLRVTNSRDFLQQSVSSEVSVNGLDYLNEIAKYWNDKFELDSLSNLYEIKGVSFGERTQTREVNNEAFTNYLAALSMDTYKYTLELSDRNPYDTQYVQTVREYDDKISRTKIPYEELRQLYLEYDTYTSSQQNEETFVPYLNYPLGKVMKYQEKKILYDTYVNQLPNEGRNMQTYASYVVGYTELNEETKARDYFTNKMGSYFNGPFLVTSEFLQTTSTVNSQNTFVYLPAYAAYAHAFIAGYCGVRYRDFQLDLVYPSEHYTQYSNTQTVNNQYPIFKLPTLQTETWNITGLMYRGNKLDIVYNLRAKSVEIRNRRSTDSYVVADETLEVITYEGSEPMVRQLRVGDSVTIGLSSELWVYAPKRQRLQRHTGYSDNMHILASIYSTTQSKRLIRASNSANTVFYSTIPTIIFSTLVAIYMKLF